MTSVPVQEKKNSYSSKGGHENVQTVVAEQKRKGLLRNEKGLTLIELLAVLVIIAIIAAIAIPSIGGIINRTKKESHRANAQIIIDAARYAVTAEGFPLVGIPDNDINNDDEFVDENNTTHKASSMKISLDELNKRGYLENVPKDPEGTNNQTYDATNSYVKIFQLSDSGKYRYAIFLKREGENGPVIFGGETIEEEIRTKPLS